MSSIHKNGKYWTMRFKYEGKQYNRSLKVTRKRAAEEIQAQVDERIAKGTLRIDNILDPGSDKDVRLPELIALFREYLRHGSKKYADTTITAYDYSCEVIQKIFGNVYLNQIDPHRFNLIPYLRKEYGWKENTIRHHLVNWRSIFGFAARSGFIEANPFHRIVPKKEKKKPVFFRTEEIEKIKQYFLARDDWQRTYFILMLNTGMRKHETFDLRWNQVFFDEHLLMFFSKGRERIVPLNDAAKMVLRQHPRQLGNDRVFWQITGITTIDTAWRRLRRTVKLPKYKIHNLRSNFASWFIMNGGNIATLMEIMGWEDYETAKIYTGLSKDFLSGESRNIVSF